MVVGCLSSKCDKGTVLKTSKERVNYIEPRELVAAVTVILHR